ncbi:MAG TPA: FAD-dependent oxidoreductase [Spirochaetales bacterium]|nr:FAD-dependent oxidoreductase [Spirochaetales bacterium]
MVFETPRVDSLPLRVAIIGGGGTGAALAWDLALRGFRVALFERGEFLSGTTGRHHGQLHSGARYASGDPEIARECMAETLALRRLVPDAIEYNGGLFVALDGEEAAYGERFAEACAEAGIPAREIAPARARELEPGLSPRVERAFLVPDGTFDAWRVPAAFLAGARALGAELRPWTEVVGFDASEGRVMAARVRDRTRASEERVEADYFVNACGAWGASIGALAGLEVPVTPAAGSMLAVKGRLCDMVISRLRPPGDGDILVPQRGLSIIGSTQRLVETPEGLLPTDGEMEFLRRSGAELAPAFADAEVDSAWCAARPLFGAALDEAGGRAASRDFAVLDHESRDRVAGVASVVGGKATTLRIMAEKAADLVCRALGVERQCRTLETAPPSWRQLYRGRVP